MSCIETITINVYKDTISLMIEEHNQNKEFLTLLDSANVSLNEAKKCIQELRNAVEGAKTEKDILQNLAKHCKLKVNHQIQTPHDKNVAKKPARTDPNVNSALFYKSPDCLEDDLNKLFDDIGLVDGDIRRQEVPLRGETIDNERTNHLQEELSLREETINNGGTNHVQEKLSLREETINNESTNHIQEKLSVREQTINNESTNHVQEKLSVREQTINNESTNHLQEELSLRKETINNKSTNHLQEELSLREETINNGGTNHVQEKLSLREETINNESTNHIQEKLSVREQTINNESTNHVQEKLSVREQTINDESTNHVQEKLSLQEETIDCKMELNGFECKPCWVQLERLNDESIVKYIQFRRESEFSLKRRKIKAEKETTTRRSDRIGTPLWRRSKRLKEEQIPCAT